MRQTDFMVRILKNAEVAANKITTQRRAAKGTDKTDKPRPLDAVQFEPRVGRSAQVFFNFQARSSSSFRVQGCQFIIVHRRYDRETERRAKLFISAGTGGVSKEFSCPRSLGRNWAPAVDLPERESESKK